MKRGTQPPTVDRLIGLPPIVSKSTVVLILGSFPGAASLAAQRYYAHPQNRFWTILSAIWTECDSPLVLNSYEKRSEWLLERGLGLWDVYASCDRAGSLDSNIRNAVLNDFERLAAHCPLLAAVAHNGAASYRHAGEVAAAFERAGPKRAAAVAFHRLPSTSPANASQPYRAKLAAWRAVFAQHGLLHPARPAPAHGLAH